MNNQWFSYIALTGALILTLHSAVGASISISDADATASPDYDLTATYGPSNSSVIVQTEAFIRGGTYASTDQNEVSTGYVMVKSSSDRSYTRKAYFQFDLSGVSVDTNKDATFTIDFKYDNPQAVTLWALDQDFSGFSSTLTWNQAQANNMNSNELLTTGAFTATPIKKVIFIPADEPYTFTIHHPGDYIFNDHLTLALTGVDSSGNDSGGLRIKRQSATLDFVEHAPVHYDVYLASGQSNMDGRGSRANLVGASYRNPQEDVRIYYVNPINESASAPSHNTGWQVMRTGWSATNADPLPSATFGPELSFGRAMADANPDRHIAIIKISKGGTSLRTDWNITSGYLYRTFENFLPKALQSLTDEGASYTLRGMIWHQGESDAVSTVDYEPLLTNFIAAVRQTTGDDNLPFVVGELAQNRSAKVRRVQFEVSQTVPYVGFASSEGLETLDPTDPHFTAPSQVIMGQRMALSMSNLLKTKGTIIIVK